MKTVAFLLNQYDDLLFNVRLMKYLVQKIYEKLWWKHVGFVKCIINIMLEKLPISLVTLTKNVSYWPQPKFRMNILFISPNVFCKSSRDIKFRARWGLKQLCPVVHCHEKHWSNKAINIIGQMIFDAISIWIVF